MNIKQCLFAALAAALVAFTYVAEAKTFRYATTADIPALR